jgi:hypothetical protein
MNYYEIEFIEYCKNCNLIDVKNFIFSNSNITIDTAFHLSCKNNYIEIVEWLEELNPIKYIAVINYDEKKIIAWTIKQIYDIVNSSDIMICPICYENKSNLITCCNHQFCKNCIDIYEEDNCAYCRKNNIRYYEIKSI